MALTVEDGSIVAGADSYVTLDTYQAYAIARGWATGTETEDEINLRRAFDIINRNWRYRGEAVDYDNQVGAFPRYIVKSRWEYVTPADEIPQRVKDAQCELAYLVKGGLDPFETISGVVGTTRAKAGPVETETTYLGGLSKPRIVAVEGLLAPFLLAGYGQVRAVRA